MQSITAADIEGMPVMTERGEQAGEVENLVRSAADDKLYVVIDHGGFLGLGEKTVALSLEGLLLQGDRIVVPTLTDEEIEALPEFEESDQFPEVEDTAEAQIRVLAQQ
jgi:sporulation protein YlmC with PRC-barrel domain